MNQHINHVLCRYPLEGTIIEKVLVGKLAEVVSYLDEYPRSSKLDAAQKPHCHVNLAQYIYVLKKNYGIKLFSEQNEYTRRDGRQSRFKRYSLPKGFQILEKGESE